MSTSPLQCPSTTDSLATIAPDNGLNGSALSSEPVVMTMLKTLNTEYRISYGRTGRSGLTFGAAVLADLWIGRGILDGLQSKESRLAVDTRLLGERSGLLRAKLAGDGVRRLGRNCVTYVVLAGMLNDPLLLTVVSLPESLGVLRRVSEGSVRNWFFDGCLVNSTFLTCSPQSGDPLFVSAFSRLGEVKGERHGCPNSS